MTTAVESVVQVLEAVTREVDTSFGPLTVDQLNWTPGPGRWSIAQCLDHLITTNALYFPVFDAIASGRYTPSIWARLSPFSGFFGRFLVRSLDPANARPIKTVPIAAPSSSALPADIVARFIVHQQDLIRRLRALPATVDPATLKMASPLAGAVTYSLADGLQIIAVHEQRHLGQAKRVHSQRA